MLRALRFFYNLAPCLTEVILCFSILLKNFSHHYLCPDSAYVFSESCILTLGYIVTCLYIVSFVCYIFLVRISSCFCLPPLKYTHLHINIPTHTQFSLQVHLLCGLLSLPNVGVYVKSGKPEQGQCLVRWDLSYGNG